MREEDLQTVRALVRERSGLELPEGKEYLIRARLEPLARSHGRDGLPGLLAWLRNGAPEALREQVAEALTVGETSFLRDRHPFDLLRAELLPGLAARAGRPLSLWSAACSTGQEAYSLAMLVMEAAAGGRILATDFCGAALGKARSGVYSRLEVNRGLPASMLLRHFDPAGDAWRVKERLRGLVEFRRVNLLGEWPAGERHDAVFVRNVLMYMAPEARRRVLDRVRDALHPGGCLFLGAAELLREPPVGLETVHAGRVVYWRRPA